VLASRSRDGTSPQGAKPYPVNESIFTWGYGGGGGDLSWGNIIGGGVALAVCIGGSMLWVRWREQSRKRAKT
jgi:hypothetical protein